MSRLRIWFALAGAACVAACASSGSREGTLAELRRLPADTEPVVIDDSLELAMQSYRRFLTETPDGAMTPEAMRRLADLQIEQQFGIMGDGDIIELPPPELNARPSAATTGVAAATGSAGSASSGLAATSAESEADFEARATSEFEFDAFEPDSQIQLPDSETATALSGPLEAIRIYQQILDQYPSYERADQVLYQMARAYDEVGQPDDAMAIMERFVAQYAFSGYADEVQFRRGEYLFTRREFRDAENAYGAILTMGPSSEYYELALYKLGWSLYKQEFYDLALDQFMALLDYKLLTGYNFDIANADEEEEERRVEDTFRVISLGFSNIGGPEVLNEYFAASGRRSFEDRIYSNLGEFYLEKLRYQDAAQVYASFVDLNPFHRVAPKFSMRIVEIYGDGAFPILVVESKKDFATRYGLQGEYWQYFDPIESPEVLGFLKTNLSDLANHYHALYQDETLEEEQFGNYDEAAHWYREYLVSFPADPESPSINYQLADLMLEHEDFAGAALEYERTAYDYAAHDQASAAGYAAIFSHRQNLEGLSDFAHADALRATVDSSLRFADTFPEHDNASIVLGAAADDLYQMQEFETAIVAGTKLVERYPAADPALRRAAWTVVAHSSLDLSLFAEAEAAYSSVLQFVPADDEERTSLVDNLAASIYQQGALAGEAGDYRAAADHYLRVGQAAPGSAIRSSAEYDAAAALILLEEWNQAGQVLQDFRAAFPEHELQGEVTKQLASVYRNAGQLDRSADEFVRVADEQTDPELQSEALLTAGELYEDSGEINSALAVYRRYVDNFPGPLDLAQETRNTMAGLYDDLGDSANYRAMLEEIVASDTAAGGSRTDRSRYLAAHSALILTEDLFDGFAAVRLTQPFDLSLVEKQQRMSDALAAFEGLVAYQVSDVTAAATFYIAEIYFDFSQSLLESERPDDLSSSELVEYELAIEEEAFPFEEQAIDVHEQNFALLANGVFNPWVERSLGKLAEMMPGRYAKGEISSGFVGSVDSYAYRSPGAPVPEVGEAMADIVDGGR